MTSDNNSTLLRHLSAQEGGLVEIAITGTVYDDWVNAVRGLASAGYAMVLKQYEEPVPLLIAPSFFTDGEEIAYTLVVTAGRQLWTTQFYSTSLLDFQGDPCDIADSKDIQDVMDFMQVIANSTRREVRMIPETLDYEGAVAYICISPGGA